MTWKAERKARPGQEAARIRRRTSADIFSLSGVHPVWALITIVLSCNGVLSVTVIIFVSLFC